MAKALLILFGGRIIPNVLTILHEKPQLIVPIVSGDKYELIRLDNFKKGVDDLLLKEGYDYKWLDSQDANTFRISPFNKQNIKQVCEDVVKGNQYCEDVVKGRQAYEWIFNITSGTSIMSIGAYEAAKELKAQDIPVQCWYLNTASTRVEVLLEEERDRSLDKSLFTISIDEYAIVHNKVLRVNMKEDKLPPEEKRLAFAQFLIRSHTYIRALSTMLVMKNQGNPSVLFQISQSNRKQEYYRCTRVLSIDEKEVLKMAEKCDLISNLTSEKTSLSFEISSHQFQFLNGGWLELYVCNEVSNIKKDGQPLFQDVQRNRLVHNKTEQDFNQQGENELDVSMMYNAQLFIIECKAGNDAKESKTIFTLDSVANAFGGGFVGKYLVTGLSKNELDRPDNKNFRERLDARRIKLITWDDLTNLEAIFKGEATDPTYQRI